MATTIQEVAQFLDNQEVQYERDPERNVIITAYNTEQYINEEEQNKLGMLIRLEENGEFIKIFAPQCYSCPDEANRAAVTQTLLMISWKTKMVQFEFDANDGEIRAIVEFPLEDAPLTERQLMRAIIALVQVVDKFHPVIHLALTEGVIQFPENEDNPLAALQAMMAEFQGLLDEMGIDIDDIEALTGEEGASTEKPGSNKDDTGDDFDDDDYI